MSSIILFDKRNNSILRCQIKPKGDAHLPSFDSICKSARISESEKKYLKTITIKNNFLTKKAKKELRIINNEVFEKPKLKINLSDNQIKAGSTIRLDLKISETIESDDFQNINMKINDIEFKVDIENNQGSKEIQLDEPDEYIIKCNDHRFRSQSVTVEVV